VASLGHESGRRIVAVKRKKKDELTDDDIEHMRRVVGYARRRLAQGAPGDDNEQSKWRHSLMNSGAPSVDRRLNERRRPAREPRLDLCARGRLAPSHSPPPLRSRSGAALTRGTWHSCPGLPLRVVRRLAASPLTPARTTRAALRGVRAHSLRHLRD